MAITSAFQAMSKTYKANATTSTQTITITPDGPCNKLCVANHQPTGTGGQPVYFNLSTSNSSITCTAPSNGSPQSCLVSVPGTIKVFQIPGQASNTNPLYVAFIGEAASECYFTLGEGL
jgi:hypothetical protein